MQRYEYGNRQKERPQDKCRTAEKGHTKTKTMSTPLRTGEGETQVTEENNHHSEATETEEKEIHTIPTIITKNRFKLSTHTTAKGSETNTSSSHGELKFKGHNHVLSNFFPCKLYYNGQVFRSAEHLYQTRHAWYLQRPDIAQQIQSTKHTGEAKRIAGKLLPKTDRWACEKADIMLEILLLKAKQVPEFRQTLQETGKLHLAHNVPEFWGTGRTGGGGNMMGKILEELRCSTNQTGGSTPELADKDNHPRSGEQQTSILLTCRL